MIAHLLVSIVLAATPVVSGTAAAKPAANPPITRGPMTFTGDRVKLETAGAKGEQAFLCLIDGKARVTFGTDGDVDFTIEADRIEVRSDAEGRSTVRAEGHCRYTDGENRCSAETLQFLGSQEAALTLTGDVVVRFGEAGKERVVTASSMSFVRGKWVAK